ncbi:MAG: ABC transporter ATP-binding protein [Anaerolineales bacterium]|nr:ABC transporter ATP-binding protein [Anaerolineales bacterium]
MLEIRDLCVQVHGEEILHHVDLTIPHGEVHALLGPNGSGKTSLMMTIMGFSNYVVTQGRIKYQGVDITESSISERARMGIGVSQQRPPTIPGVTLRQILDFEISQADDRAVMAEDWISQARVEGFLDRFVNAGLSGGEIKRSELLQMLLGDVQLAMLDEPDSGVDLEALDIAGSLVNAILTEDPAHPARRKTGLIITHTGQILDYVQADKAHILIDGRMVGCGNPHLIIDTVSQHGYSACGQCLQESF